MTEIIKHVGIGEILKMLPHRYPFLLVDKMRDVVPGKSGVGIKNVTMNEPFFQGHFPENPIMPGVLQVEAMAQTAGLVTILQFPEDAREGFGVLFMTVDGVKFRKPVLPGDILDIHVTLERSVRSIYKFKGIIKNGDVVVSEATFSAMIIHK